MKFRPTHTAILIVLALILSVVPAAGSGTGHAAAQSICDWAQFTADITIPDGTNFSAGTPFKKTWRIKNIGTCTWTTSYTLVFDSGERMGAPAALNLPASVAPGQTVDLSVDMTAPAASGHYFGYWKFKNASGVSFGIGSTANKSFWVEINVGGASSVGVAYDFTANAGSAAWSSGAGALAFPGTENNANGFALRRERPQFEGDFIGTFPGLLFVPQNITNGYLQAVYPAFRIQAGDKFQTTVGCETNATACYVAYRLDYQIGTGPVTTFWTFREKYEGWTFNANIDLSALAGKDVKFILVISAFGSPAGDRALWGSPIIARSGSPVPITVTPSPTGTPSTPTATVTGTPPSPTPTRTGTPQPAGCDRAQFVADVTVPDGTLFAPGAVFTKTWRLKNSGTCTWSTSYMLIFDTGEKMGGPDALALPKSVAPGQTVDLSIPLTAPNTTGTFRGYWKFKNAAGVPFGIGTDGTKSFWVEIRVSGPTVTPGGPTVTPTLPVTLTPGTPVAGSSYDFALNGCTAKWFSSAGALPCPGTEGDGKGFVLLVSNPKLENGTTDSRAGLLTFPQNVNNGYIQGFFPAYKVKAGDRFRSIINCESGATACYVVFRLDYTSGTDTTIKTFWAFVEKYEGMFYQSDLDLSPLLGQDIKFILTVLSTGSPAGDRALWVAPMIFNPANVGTATGTLPASSTATRTPTPTGTLPATATPPSTGSLNFTNQKYGFKFSYPSQGQLSNQTDTSAHIALPIVPGTNLKEKYLDVAIRENLATCTSPLTAGYAPGSFISQPLIINGINFTKESGVEGTLGNFYDWTAFSTTKGNACISMSFVLHSLQAGNFATPPPLFNQAAESAVFADIMATFAWLAP